MGIIKDYDEAEMYIVGCCFMLDQARKPQDWSEYYIQAQTMAHKFQEIGLGVGTVDTIISF